MERASLEPPPSSGEAWWDRHKDKVLYPTVGSIVVVVGLVWNGALSLILTPIWMLIGVWLIPSMIEQRVRDRR